MALVMRAPVLALLLAGCAGTSTDQRDPSQGALECGLYPVTRLLVHAPEGYAIRFETPGFRFSEEPACEAAMPCIVVRGETEVSVYGIDPGEFTGYAHGATLDEVCP